jgi:hypothetical protein
VKRHREGVKGSTEKGGGGIRTPRHFLEMLSACLEGWSVGRSVGLSTGLELLLEVTVKSLTLRQGWGVEASQQSLRITQDRGTLFSERLGQELQNRAGTAADASRRWPPDWKANSF